VQPCVSPVWDTCLALSAVAEAGLSHEHTAIKPAIDWLFKKQAIRDCFCHRWKRISFHNDCIYVAFLLSGDDGCAQFCCLCGWTSFHRCRIWKFFHPCEYECVSLNVLCLWKISCKYCIRKAFLPNESSYVSLNSLLHWTISDKFHTEMVSLLNEFACGFSHRLESEKSCCIQGIWEPFRCGVSCVWINCYFVNNSWDTNDTGIVRIYELSECLLSRVLQL